ncbi:uncharacterized protein LOC124814026 [Hydra vulgaris]|uniref:uncharacterized protein LOC124814026 n=1 Tax=Hydra vulgaris TaxID=6087 RepID=UPI0032EA3623
MTPKKKVRSIRLDKIFLVKKLIEKLPAKKFATAKEIVQYYLFLRKSKSEAKLRFLVGCPNKSSSFIPNCPVDQSDCCILSKLMVPWILGGFRVLTIQKLRIKIEKLLKEWMKLKDQRYRTNPAEIKIRHLFEEQMSKVFWIGKHPNVIKESLGGRDKRYEYSVIRSKRSTSKFSKNPSVELNKNDSDYLSSASYTSDELGEETDIDFDFNEHPNDQNSVLLPKNILQSTAHTAVGEGITPHQHTALISSVIVMSGGSVANFNCSKSTSYRAAENIISARAKEIREYIKNIVILSDSLMTIHFDGKIVNELTERKQFKKDRIAVLLKIDKKTELLGIPPIDSSSGVNQKQAIVELMEYFGLKDKVKCLCFDTTSANTGRWQGTCMKLIQQVQRPLLLIACRHHVIERHIAHFWKIYPSSETSGPENKLFEVLKQNWNSIDAETKELKRIIIPPGTWIYNQKLAAVQFCNNVISLKIFKKDRNIRKEYHELAELTLMVLSSNRFKFHLPGPIHHSRFMGKGLYYLKLYLLMNEIQNLTDKHKEEITGMALFISLFYTEWFLKAELSSLAPTQDIKAYWQMKRFEEWNLLGSRAVANSILRHTWYLDPTLVVFALANKECRERGDMAKKLYSLQRCPSESFPLERQVMDQAILNSLNFSKDEPPSLTPLVTEKSWLVFDMLRHGKAETQWMKTPPEVWKFNDYYLEFRATVKGLDVVNDCSERAVKLVQDLINRAYSEEKKQDTFLFTNSYKKNRKGRKKTDYEKAANKD